MPKILITGNGFDLFHYLPTKYDHFISILETIEKNDFDGDILFEELFGRCFKTKHQYEYNVIVENFNTENIKFDYEKLMKVKDLLKTNQWYTYFKNITEIDSWIDFEIEIETILNKLIDFKNHLTFINLKVNYIDINGKDYLDLEILDIIIIHSNRLVKLKEKYFNHRSSFIDLRVILEDLVKVFKDFIIIFNHYLLDIVSVFYTVINKKTLNPFHLIDEFYTFNYTPTFEEIYDIDKSKVVYLHGKINHDCQKQNLVLGVSEISDEIKLNKGFDFTKYYQKINKNCNKEFINIPSKNQAYDEETFFYIIGHSLDKSDSEYILDLFRFLEADIHNKSRICVFYYDDRDRENKIRNLLSVVEEKVISKMNREGRLYFVELSYHNLSIEFNKEPYKNEIWV